MIITQIVDAHGKAPEVTGSLSKAGHTPDGTLLLKPLLAAKQTAPDRTAGIRGSAFAA